MPPSQPSTASWRRNGRSGPHERRRRAALPRSLAESEALDLTPRQLEILALLKAGKANKDIAYELGIGLGTVKQHVVALFKKLNVTNRAMAVGKGWQLAGRMSAAPAVAPVGDVVDSALELRPSCVLSLAVDAAAAADDDGWRLLQNAAAHAAVQEDSTLVARPGGIDVIFGLNRVREDDVLRAFKVAHATAVALGEACAAAARPRPALRAGLSCGHLVASVERRGGWTGETVAGRLIGDARALRAAAGPDELVADHAARRMMAFALRADGEPAPEDMAPLRLRLGVTPRRGRRKAPRVAMVGRRAELARLVGHLEALRGGHGGLVWLEGEAGMGKTTLGHACAAQARALGLDWLECRCGAGDGDLPARLLGLAGHRTRLAEPPVETVAAVVAARAARAPLALMVDDVHQARPREAALLLGLAAATRGAPLLLLGVGRSLRPGPLRELAGDDAVKLTRLSAEEVATLIHRDSKGRLRGRAAQDVVEMAQGVPLFAHELAWEALRDADAALGLPPTLATLVMSRLDTLGLDRPLLRLAAARGGIEERTLAALWPGTPEALAQEIERAVRAGILVRDGTGERQGVVFAHPMVRAILAHVLMTGQGDLAAGIEAGRAAIAAI